MTEQFFKLKQETEVEPERIGTIAERVFADIERRVEQRRRDHRRSILAAAAEFLSGKSKPGKRGRIQKPEAESDLFSKAKP